MPACEPQLYSWWLRKWLLNGLNNIENVTVSSWKHFLYVLPYWEAFNFGLVSLQKQGLCNHKVCIPTQQPLLFVTAALWDLSETGSPVKVLDSRIDSRRLPSWLKKMNSHWSLLYIPLIVHSNTKDPSCCKEIPKNSVLFTLLRVEHLELQMRAEEAVPPFALSFSLAKVSCTAVASGHGQFCGSQIMQALGWDTEHNCRSTKNIQIST